MFEILCVTNRRICREDFLLRIEKIASCRPDGILLREKDLSEQAYEELAVQVMELCERYGVRCILHHFPRAASRRKSAALHLPLPVLRTLSPSEKAEFPILGASCHSLEEAIEAELLGCTYITAGHVFATDCKKGVPGRGLGFLGQICELVSLPVYAIGGISAENAAEVKRAGAKGICVMSGMMTCGEIGSYLDALRGAVQES